MLKNYFKIALRNFSRNKVYGSINLSGLLIGMISFLIISLYIFQELSYDRFHPDAENVFRIQMNRYDGEELLFESAVTFPAVGPALVADIPEVEEYMRILPFGVGVFTYEGAGARQQVKSFNEDKSVFADHNFFTYFGFELIQGEASSVLAEPMQVVISESAADRYFGNDIAIGKTLNWRGRQDYIVSGVMADMPVNSHMSFDIIMSLSSWDGFEDFPEVWGWYDFYTFVRLQAGADNRTFESKMEGFMEKYKGEGYTETGRWETLFLQPLTGIHLYSNLSWDMGDNGGGEMVYFLMAIAVLILVIAWVNFINLATARAIKRAREIGIRKAIGAQRSQLIYQFLCEAFLYNIVSIGLSILVTILILPWFNQVNDLRISAGLLFEPYAVLGFIILIIVGTLISGLYPAFVLTSFKSTLVLKGSVSQKSGIMFFRKALVFFQFTATIVLIVGTFTVLRQMNYMRSQDLGIDIAKNLVLIAPTTIPDRDVMISKVGMLKNELLAYPGILGFSMSSSIPGTENFGIGPIATRSQPDEWQDVYRVQIDHDFIDNYGINMLAGRNFSKDFISDSGAVILNEAAIQQLNIESPAKALEENLTGRMEWEIVGVIKDYHEASLRQELNPMVFYLTSSWGRYLSLKLEGGNIPQIMEIVKKSWDVAFADAPMEYFFLDEHFNKVYKAEDRFNSLFMTFTFLAIFVACLGLFGLVSFTAEQSAKAISIRKVLGSSVIGIVINLTREYLVLISVSMLIAFPISYILMEKWLSGFAFRMDMNGMIFLTTGLLTTLIAIGTVSFQSVAAARANPAEVLRNE